MSVIISTILNKEYHILKTPSAQHIIKVGINYKNVIVFVFYFGLSWNIYILHEIFILLAFSKHIKIFTVFGSFELFTDNLNCWYVLVLFKLCMIIYVCD